MSSGCNFQRFIKHQVDPQTDLQAQWAPGLLRHGLSVLLYLPISPTCVSSPLRNLLLDAVGSLVWLWERWDCCFLKQALNLRAPVPEMKDFLLVRPSSIWDFLAAHKGIFLDEGFGRCPGGRLCPCWGHGDCSGGAYRVGVQPMVFPVHWWDPGGMRLLVLQEDWHKWREEGSHWPRTRSWSPAEDAGARP